MATNPITTSVNTNYFQGMQDYFQKTIDTSDSSISRAFAAIGQFFNTALNSLAGTQPLEISRYHKEIDKGNTKISTVAFAILTNKSADEITGLLEKGAPVDQHAITAFNKRLDLKQSLLLSKLEINLPKGDLQRTEIMKVGEIKKILDCIKAGANVNAQDINGRTALSLAFEAANKNAIKTLLANGADIHLADKSGKTPLMYAVENPENKNENLLRILQNQEHTTNDLNKTDKKGMTALMYAAQAENTAAVTLLLQYDADPLLKNSEGKTALELTLSTDTKASSKSQVDDQETRKKSLEDAEVQSRKDSTLKAGAITAAQITFSWTQEENELFEACRTGDVDAMGLLLKSNKVNINKRDNMGFTPLMLAAGHGNRGVLELLLKQKGIDVNAQSTETTDGLGGRTALMLAIENHCEGTTKALLKNETVKGGLTIENKEGKTAAKIAEENKSSESDSMKGFLKTAYSGASKGERIFNMVMNAIEGENLKAARLKTV